MIRKKTHVKIDPVFDSKSLKKTEKNDSKTKQLDIVHTSNKPQLGQLTVAPLKQDTVQKCNMTQEKLFQYYQTLKPTDDCPACEKHSVLVMIADHKSEKDNARMFHVFVYFVTIAKESNSIFDLPDDTMPSDVDFFNYFSTLKMENFLDLKDNNAPGLKYLQLPDDVSFLYEEVHLNKGRKTPSVLFVRKEYEELFEIISRKRDVRIGLIPEETLQYSAAKSKEVYNHKDVTQQESIILDNVTPASGAVILGNPGIGKSCGFLYYCLARFAILKAIVLFEAQNQKAFYIFDFSGKGNMNPVKRVDVDAARKKLSNIKDSSVVYLIDPSAKSAIMEPVYCAPFTLLFSSPDKKHYSQFIKKVSLLFYLPVWSLNELLAFGKFAFPDMPNVSRNKMITKHFDTVGGLIRHVYSLNNYLKGVNNISEAIVEMEDESKYLFLYLRNEMKHVGNFNANSHSIFHAHVKSPYLEPMRVEFASLYVARLVFERFEELVEKKRDHYAILHSPISAAGLFEPLVNHTIAAGGVFDGGILFQKQIKSSLTCFKDDKFIFPRMKIDFFTFSELQDKKLAENTLYLATTSTEKAIDVFYYENKEVYLIQTTLAQKHPVSCERMLDFLNFFKGFQVVLMFALLDNNYVNFQKQSYDGIRKIPGNYVENRIKLDGIIQFKLCIRGRQKY